MVPCAGWYGSRTSTLPPADSTRGRFSPRRTTNAPAAFRSCARTRTGPHFACRCSRDRVINALKTLGPAELRDMAEKDAGADLTCDFCSASYRIEADELLRLASR